MILRLIGAIVGIAIGVSAVTVAKADVNGRSDYKPLAAYNATCDDAYPGASGTAEEPGAYVLRIQRTDGSWAIVGGPVQVHEPGSIIQLKADVLAYGDSAWVTVTRSGYSDDATPQTVVPATQVTRPTALECTR